MYYEKNCWELEELEAVLIHSDFGGVGEREVSP